MKTKTEAPHTPTYCSKIGKPGSKCPACNRIVHMAGCSDGRLDKKTQCASQESEECLSHKTTHTPLPWEKPKSMLASEFIRFLIYDDELGRGEENAEFIFRACNEYEKNQKTIEALIDCMTRVANTVRLVSGVNTFPLKLSKGFEAIAEELEKAIAQAEGK